MGKKKKGGKKKMTEEEIAQMEANNAKYHAIGKCSFSSHAFISTWQRRRVYLHNPKLRYCLQPSK